MSTGADPLRAALPALRCPHCAAALARGDDGPLRCENGHAFDVARQGYVNLLDHRPRRPDTAEMVAARAAFLGAGHFAPIEAAIADAAGAVTAGGMLLDLGAGIGSYAAAALERMPGQIGIALDTSKPALQRAARAHPRLAAVGADVTGPLPLVDGAVALALDVFAPRNGAEYARVLAPGGTLVVVYSTTSHQRELVARLGLLTVDNLKEERLDKQLGRWLRRVDSVPLEWTMTLDPGAVRALVGMGPTAHHPDADRATRLAALAEPLAVTASVTVARYVPR